MHNILFVDDELIYKLTIQNLVDWEKHGFSIIGTASNGEEALEFFKNKPVHAVITDLQMPIMDGITLIQELRKYGFAGPILALSNYSDYEYVRGALIAGAYDYLIKINITKEQVEKSLHQMSEMLASSPELQSSDTRLQEKSAFDQESLRLYTYLVNPEQTAPSFQFPLLSEKLSFPLLVISINLKTAKQAHAGLLQFLHSTVSEAFQNPPQLHLIQMADNEFLFLCSQEILADFDVPKRLTAIGRQIAVFLSTTTRISYSTQVQDFPAIKKFFRLTSQGVARDFYDKPADCLQISTTNNDEEFRTQRELFISSALSALRGQDVAAIHAFADSFVAFCSQSMIEPRRLKSVFEILLRCSRDIAVIGADNEKMHDAIYQVEQSTSAASLIKNTLDFFKNNITSAKEASESIRPEIAKALLFINKNYMNRIALDDVAKNVGLSKEYISRLFLKEVGMNLFRYINEVRMRKAAEILTSEPNALIKEVAASVGFENQYFFSTKFKEYYGVSPNNYKDQ